MRSRPPLPQLTAEQALRQRWRIFWICAVLAAIALQMPPPKEEAKPAVAKPAVTNDPVARCEGFLLTLDWSGVDTEKAIGAPSGMFGRAHWCLIHQHLFGGQ